MNIAKPIYSGHIATKNNVTIITKNVGAMIVNKSNKAFTKIVQALTKKRFDLATTLTNKALFIETASKGRFKVENNRVKIGDTFLPQSLSDRIVMFANEGLNFDPLLKFWNNLKQNPCEGSKQELYEFLLHAGIPISDDGCFIAYKRVTKDFKDFHTSTFDNSIGKIVKMERAKVDPDRRQECSNGLHVAAFGYAKGFQSTGHIVAVKVNPKHVVAVPKDANGQKMRVCQYEVIEVVSKEFEEVLYKTTRTYYYSGTKRRGDFNPNRVTSHKPEHFLYTVRGVDLSDAQAKMKKEFWSK